MSNSVGRPKGSKNVKVPEIKRKSFGDKVREVKERYSTLLNKSELTLAETIELLKFCYMELQNVSEIFASIEKKKLELKSRIKKLTQTLTDVAFPEEIEVVDEKEGEIK